MAAIEVTHEDVVVNGVRLHTVAAGDPADPLVVCLHGFPEFWYAWRKQLPALVDAGYRVIAPDMRGYNRSEKPRGVDAYRLATLTRDVVDLIHETGRDSARVVGHDWGGVVAFELAARYPVVVDRLAVLNAPHLRAYREALRSPAQLGRAWYVVGAQCPGVERLLTAGDLGWLRRTLREDPVSADAFTDADLDRYVAAAARPGAMGAALNYYRSLGRATVRDAIPLVAADPGGGRVDVPTLLVWGDRDRALVPQLPDRCRRYVDDLTVRHVDASHWVQNDAPAAVNDALVEFL